MEIKEENDGKYAVGKIEDEMGKTITDLSIIGNIEPKWLPRS